jgi:Sap, sulfolipid-1-addressing protein
VDQAVLYALAVALSPVPIAAILIILSSRGASTDAAWFAGGWTLGVTTSAAVFALLVANLNVNSSRPAWIGGAYLVLAVGFLAAATSLWLRRGRLPTSPGWLDIVDHFTPVRSATLGIVLSDANPKVLALSLGAALSLGRTRASSLATAWTVALFSAIAALGVLVPIVICLILPAQSAPRLTSLRTWLGTHERVVLTMLALAISGVFLRDGLNTLT